jgi:A/G-specific adenine glycosylase
MTPKEIKIFQDGILTWYAAHQRDLPWRKSRDPYRILVSEIMLQQTQVNRVMPKFTLWFEKFPTVHDLAKAKVSDVLALWSGLGYNRRALNLKKTAQIVSEKYNGKFPDNEKELLALPGIGQYTARALLCFAFNQQVTVIDTNVRKVILIRLQVPEKDIPMTAEKILPKGKAYEWNQALMDYSSAMLKEHKIAIPKQSKFIGSHRYYRGQILKKLLEKKEIELKELGNLIKKDYSEKEYKWLNGLVLELKDEGFVETTKESIKLTS